MMKKDRDLFRAMLGSLGPTQLARVAVSGAREQLECGLRDTEDPDALNRAREVGEAARALRHRDGKGGERYRKLVADAGEAQRAAMTGAPAVATCALVASVAREGAHAHCFLRMVLDLTKLLRALSDSVPVPADEQAEVAVALRSIDEALAAAEVFTDAGSAALKALADEADARSHALRESILSRTGELARQLSVDTIVPEAISELLCAATTLGMQPR